MKTKLTLINHNNEKFIIKHTKVVINYYGGVKPSSLKVYIDTNDLYVSPGNTIIFELDDKVIFNGFVFTESKSYDNFYILAYDRLRYLLCKDTYIFRNQTASNIINRILLDKKLPVGNIQNTGYKIPSLLFNNEKLLDMIGRSIMETHKNTGISYYLFDELGKISLKQAREIDVSLSFNTNILSFNRGVTIDNNFYNSVKLNQTNKFGVINSIYLKDSESIKKYGSIQYFENVNRDTPKSIAKKQAYDILERHKNPILSLTLTSIGHIDAKPGNIISVKLREGEKFIKYEILEATHTFNECVHTMDLALSLAR